MARPNLLLNKYLVLFVTLLFFLAFQLHLVAQNPLGLLYKGKKDTNYVYCYKNSNKIYQKFTIVNGNIHGLHTTYYSNGKLMRVTYWNQGRFNSVNIEYSGLDLVALRTTWKNDTLIDAYWVKESIFYPKIKKKIYYEPYPYKNIYTKKLFVGILASGYLYFDIEKFAKHTPGMRIDSIFSRKGFLTKVIKSDSKLRTKEKQSYDKTGNRVDLKCYLKGKKVSCAN